MNIVYNSDENYIKYASVSIVSLLENNRSQRDINIYILGNGISGRSRETLSGLVHSYGTGRSIAYIDISDMEKKVRELSGRDVEVGRFSFTALGRIFAPELIAADRLLYIDCDTVIDGDMSPVYDMKLPKPYIAAMAPEPTIYPEVKERLGLSRQEPYFNAGVILMDAEAWRREGILKKAAEYMRRSGDKLEFADQDILNVVLKGLVRPLPQRYNFFSGYYYRRFGGLTKLFPGYAGTETRESFEAARKKPVLIHFAGDERPWIAGSRSPYRRLYKGYKQLSPWRDEPDIGGQRAYMLFYHFVDLITLVCPELRRLISEIYYWKRFKKGKD